MTLGKILTESKDLSKELRGLSSGTLANEFNTKKYDEIDKIQADLVTFYQKEPKKYKNWMDVVKAYKATKNITEGKADYIVYHNSYSDAVSEMLRFIEANKYVLDDLNNYYDGEQVDNVISIGKAKPKKGMTNKIDLDLYRKRADKYLLQKKAFHAQVYNRGTNGNEFELNMYIL